MRTGIKTALSVLAILALLASFATLTGCKSEDTLLLYTECGLPPYEFDYNNEIVGVDIEIARAVADELGKKLVIRDVNFDNILSGVQSGKADLGAAGITIREDRKENLDFSIPYSSSEQYVIVQAGQPIPSVEDLSGKQIGFQQGTTSDFLVEDLIKAGKITSAELTGYNTPVIAAAALGKIDAVVADQLTAEIIVAGSNGTLLAGRLAMADGTSAGEVEEYGVIVSKGNTEMLEVVNRVITRLLEDGSIEQWTDKYNHLATEGESAE